MQRDEIIEKLVEWIIKEPRRSEELGYFPYACPDDIFDIERDDIGCVGILNCTGKEKECHVLAIKKLISRGDGNE